MMYLVILLIIAILMKKNFIAWRQMNRTPQNTSAPTNGGAMDTAVGNPSRKVVGPSRLGVATPLVAERREESEIFISGFVFVNDGKSLNSCYFGFSFAMYKIRKYCRCQEYAVSRF